MRGSDNGQQKLFSYMSVEERISDKHPIRFLRIAVDKMLNELSTEFDQLYSAGGRPSIPPEQLLRALLLQITHSDIFRFSLVLLSPPVFALCALGIDFLRPAKI